MRPTPAQRFDRYVERSGPVHPRLGTACWLWTGTLIWNGYGRFRVNGRKVLAHRFAWEQVNGPAGDALVLHDCDVRKCVRPDHLFLGNTQANSDDMVQKGRHVSANARKTHCKRGHAYTPANTILQANGKQRACRTCVNESQLRRWHSRRQRVPA